MADVILATVNDVDMVIRDLGPFTILYSDTDLETGHPLTDVSEGMIILDVYMDVKTQFSGNAVTYGYPVVSTNVPGDTNLFPTSNSPSLDTLAPSTGESLVALGQASASNWWVTDIYDNSGPSATAALPCRVTVDSSLLITIPVGSGGPPTAGEVDVYIRVAVPM